MLRYLRRDPERPVDHLDERPFFAKDESFRLSHREIGDRLGIGFQARSVGFIRGKAVKCDQAPRLEIRSFVREKVADEVAAAARDDASPIRGVLPETLFLER